MKAARLHLATMHVRARLPVLLLLLATVGGGAATGQTRPPPPNRAPTLAERLDLGLDQQPALKAYEAELALEREDASHGRAQAQLLNGMTTPQRLDWMQAQQPGRDADARRSAAATRAFYEALHPDQRARFDRLTRIPLDPPAGRPPATQPQAAPTPAPRPLSQAKPERPRVSMLGPLV